MISTPPELPDLPVVAAPPRPASGLRDFDFLHGRWTIRNFRLRRPLTGSSDWFAFDGSSVERPVWNGQGNLEEYSATLPDSRTLRGLAHQARREQAFSADIGGTCEINWIMHFTRE